MAGTAGPAHAERGFRSADPAELPRNTPRNRRTASGYSKVFSTSWNEVATM